MSELPPERPSLTNPPRRALLGIRRGDLEISPRSTVANAALLVGGLILLSRVTGLIRLQAIAYLFGQTWQTDAYMSAFNIPDFIYFLMSGGALATGFVPVFTEYLAKGNKSQER